jgi:hypothetical protein
MPDPNALGLLSPVRVALTSAALVALTRSHSVQVRLGGFDEEIYGTEPSNNLQGAPGPPYVFIRPLDWSVISGQFSRNDGRSWQTGCPEIITNDTDAGSWTECVASRFSIAVCVCACVRR